VVFYAKATASLTLAALSLVDDPKLENDIIALLDLHQTF
jgi:hypothetical protein